MLLMMIIMMMTIIIINVLYRLKQQSRLCLFTSFNMFQLNHVTKLKMKNHFIVKEKLSPLMLIAIAVTNISH